MGKASLKAKEKLDAVLNNPNRHDNSGMKDRVMSTRDSAGSNITNRVERRQSQSSQAQHGGKIRNMMKNIWGPPAY